MKSFAQNSPGKAFRVLLLIDLSVKSTRDRLTGFIRFCSHHPEMSIVRTNNVYLLDKVPTDIDAVILNEKLSHLKARFPRRTKVFIIEAGKVIMDTEAVVQAAVDLLIRRGHRQFAYIGSHLKHEQRRSDLRGRLFASYVGSKGFDSAIYSDHRMTNSETDGGIIRLAEFLQSLPKPCGVLLYADNCAWDVFDACQYAHLSIPEQLALVGIDNDLSICENIHPSLSSVLPDFEHAGFLLGEHILSVLNRTAVRQSIQTYGVRAVVERDSTQDLTCGGLLVNRVDRYLQENFTQKIALGDLANQFNVSSRLIEIRFKKILNCTITERIDSLRIAKARHMLETTTIPVGEIATACGYGSDRAFRYAFAAATKVSPRSYRQKIAQSG